MSLKTNHSVSKPLITKSGYLSAKISLVEEIVFLLMLPALLPLDLDTVTFSAPLPTIAISVGENRTAVSLLVVKKDVSWFKKSFRDKITSSAEVFPEDIEKAVEALATICSPSTKAFSNEYTVTEAPLIIPFVPEETSTS